MRARVQKWGNSLAVRIPKSLALESQLGQNTLVEMSLEDGKIVLVPITKTEVTLEQLLESVTPTNRHSEIKTQDAVGRGIWWFMVYVPDRGDVIWLGFNPQTGVRRLCYRPRPIIARWDWRCFAPSPTGAKVTRLKSMCPPDWG